MNDLQNIKYCLMDKCDVDIYNNEEFKKVSEDFLFIEQSFKQTLSKEQLKQYILLEGKMSYLSTLEKEQMYKTMLCYSKKMVV